LIPEAKLLTVASVFFPPAPIFEVVVPDATVFGTHYIDGMF
jgi:hypothetical protein